MPWQIVASKEQFEKIKSDIRFPAIIAIARIVSSMRFAQVAFLDENSAPHVCMRQQKNSIFYIWALLCEGLIAVRNFGQYFPKSEVYKTEFKEYLRQNELVEFERHVLKDMRNTSVFHFDIKRFQNQLSIFRPASDVIFAQGSDGGAGTVTYDLADNLTLTSIIPDHDELFGNNFKKRSEQTLRFLGEYLVLADNLIAETLLDMDWAREGIGEGT